MEIDNLVVAFSNLNSNDKRNSYNEEILRIYELLKTYFDENNCNYKVHNYNSNEESEISEDEFLINEYKNILVLREMIINCIFMKKNI